MPYSFSEYLENKINKIKLSKNMIKYPSILNLKKAIQGLLIRRRYASRVIRASDKRFHMSCSHVPADIRIRKFTMNYLLDHTDWSVPRLAKELEEVGMNTDSLSLRTLYRHRKEHNMYVFQHQQLPIESGKTKSRAYRDEYNSFVRVINSNI